MMAKETPETTLSVEDKLTTLITFYVKTESVEHFATLNAGLIKICSGNLGVLGKHTDEGHFDLTIKVTLVHAVEVFTYLFRSIDLGYVQTLIMTPVYAPKVTSRTPDVVHVAPLGLKEEQAPVLSKKRTSASSVKLVEKAPEGEKKD